MTLTLLRRLETLKSCLAFSWSAVITVLPFAAVSFCVKGACWANVEVEKNTAKAATRVIFFIINSFR